MLSLTNSTTCETQRLYFSYTWYDGGKSFCESSFRDNWAIVCTDGWPAACTTGWLTGFWTIIKSGWLSVIFPTVTVGCVIIWLVGGTTCINWPFTIIVWTACGFTIGTVGILGVGDWFVSSGWGCWACNTWQHCCQQASNFWNFSSKLGTCPSLYFFILEYRVHMNVPVQTEIA